MRVFALLAAVCLLPQDDFFPAKPGTVWVYSVAESNGAAESAKDESAQVKSATAVGRHHWAEITGFLGYERVWIRGDATGLVLRIDEPTADDDSGLLILKHDAKKGESWSGEGFDQDEAKFAVEADEELKVDAGTFKCVRVGFELTHKERSNTKSVSKGTVWFAAGTGVVKASLSHDFDCHTTITKTYSLKRIEQK